MDTNFQDKEKVIYYLSVIRDAEVNKPPQEMDKELIDASVGLLLYLQDKNDNLTPEQINDAVEKIPFVDKEKIVNIKNKNKKINKLKLLLIAAIIPIILTILTIMAMADIDWSYSKILKELFDGVDKTPIGEIIFNHGNRVEKHDFDSYETPEEFSEDYDINILVPGNGFKKYKLSSITYINYSTENKIEVCFEDYDLTYMVLLNNPLPKELDTPENEQVTINGLDCYIVELSDVGLYQVYFNHNGHTYRINHSDLDVIIELIENMEEIK